LLRNDSILQLVYAIGRVGWFACGEVARLLRTRAAAKRYDLALLAEEMRWSATVTTGNVCVPIH